MHHNSSRTRLAPLGFVHRRHHDAGRILPRPGSRRHGALVLHARSATDPLLHGDPRRLWPADCLPGARLGRFLVRAFAASGSLTSEIGNCPDATYEGTFSSDSRSFRNNCPACTVCRRFDGTCEPDIFVGPLIPTSWRRMNGSAAPRSSVHATPRSWHP